MEKFRRFLVANLLAILLAIVPPIAIWYFFQREQRGLEVILVASVPVISLEKQFSEGIEIKYRSTSISSLHVLDISVKNSGNRSIQRSDFDSPLSLVFAGTILSPTQVISVRPSSLPVRVVQQSPESLSVEPLLLNSGDSFTIRTYLIDQKSQRDPVRVNGRISGIKDIVLTRAGPDGPGRRWYDFVFGILSAMVALVSLASAFRVARRLRRLTVSLPGGIAIDLSQKLEARENTAVHAHELARQLQIGRHDFKSNLLLLRLKIENQLRELAREADLSEREQVGSLTRVGHALEARGIIPHEVAAAIRDMSPVMNRELHETESYLNTEEYEQLQRLALNVVASLDSIAKERSNRPQPPNK